MDLKCRATCQGSSAAQCQHGGGLCESMTGAAQRKSVPETQTPVWTSVWVTGAGQALWDAPWQPSCSPWQPPIPKDSYWLAVTVPNATGASLRCQVFITRPSGRERKRMWKIYIYINLFSFHVFINFYQIFLLILSLYTQRDCRCWPISVPINRVYFEISMSFRKVLRARSFWQAHTDILILSHY